MGEQTGGHAWLGLLLRLDDYSIEVSSCSLQQLRDSLSRDHPPTPRVQGPIEITPVYELGTGKSTSSWGGEGDGL